MSVPPPARATPRRQRDDDTVTPTTNAPRHARNARSLIVIASDAYVGIPSDGQQMAWGEQAADFCSEFVDVSNRLQGALTPLGHSQVVHADLTGNVLFAPGLSPAVIDISPYWRPPEYAEGVVVADALCWHGAQRSLLELVDVSVTAVARALMFRMATTKERAASGAGGVDLQDEARRYRAPASAIGL